MIELLVAVGILVLLAGLTLVAVIHSKKKAWEIRTRDDLQLITMALEAYKGDNNGSYPVFADAATVVASESTSSQYGLGFWLDCSKARGAVLLCRALVGPGPAGTSQYAAPGDDGADGAGYRVRRNFNPSAGLSGKIYGPYLDSSKFKIGYAPAPSNGAAPSSDYPVLLDTSGNPILYYPAAPGNPLANLGYADPTSATSNAVSRFNAYDNQTYLDSLGGGSSFSTTSPFATLAGSCGSPPFLLYTAGADGIFGFGTNGKTDDVANFDLPANLKQ